MKHKPIISLLIYVVVAVLCAFPAMAGDVVVGNVSLDKDQLREAIRQVLRENPELVYEAYHAHQSKMKREKEAQLLERSFQNRITEPVEAWHPTKGPEKAPVTLVMYMDYQ